MHLVKFPQERKPVLAVVQDVGDQIKQCDRDEAVANCHQPREWLLATGFGILRDAEESSGCLESPAGHHQRKARVQEDSEYLVKKEVADVQPRRGRAPYAAR